MTYMLDEIYEQPEVINSLMPQWLEDIAPLAEEVRCRDIRFVYVAARGSSDHAAVYCKYALEIRNKLSVALANPSAFTLYDSAPRFTSDTLVIGISQSGAGPDVVEVVRKARADGALTACIVNTPHSALAAVSEFVLRLGLGREKSVAATKTYTSSIAMAALLSSALSSDVIASQKDIAAAIQAMESALNLDKAAAEAAKQMADMKECIVLARGFNQATALEAALKLIETCYIGARAYSGADFRHGPVAQVEAGLPCLLFAPSGSTFNSMLDLGGRVLEGGAKLICISDDTRLLGLSETPIRVAQSVPDWVSPLVYAVPAQLFACRLALNRGLDPDAPRGLNKVTMTV